MPIVANRTGYQRLHLLDRLPLYIVDEDMGDLDREKKVSVHMVGFYGAEQKLQHIAVMTGTRGSGPDPWSVDC